MKIQRATPLNGIVNACRILRFQPDTRAQELLFSHILSFLCGPGESVASTVLCLFACTQDIFGWNGGTSMQNGCWLCRHQGILDITNRTVILEHSGSSPPIHLRISLLSHAVMYIKCNKTATGNLTQPRVRGAVIFFLLLRTYSASHRFTHYAAHIHSLVGLCVLLL